MNSESCFVRADCQLSDQCIVDINGLNPNVMENIFQGHHQGNNDENSISLRHGSGTSSGACGSNVRKLFVKSPSRSENADARVDVLQFRAHSDSLAGLSYTDSQEPGELSQANALNFVAKFVNYNIEELDVEVDLGKSIGWKSKLVSCAKQGHKVWPRKQLKEALLAKHGFLIGMMLWRMEGEVFIVKGCFLL